MPAVLHQLLAQFLVYVGAGLHLAKATVRHLDAEVLLREYFQLEV